ncbi:LPS export ABC transporter permease LptG [Chiayiivirga flava]|uniref:Lipopolysaccharide export system permease protein n=1 Tax=Chiayiivirga flava TaxID=659595 RepID=A0A7W8D9N0_9GAMM|nr:LPS export ABC transporter permease LptG [Chiayiivirga flava]MBB5208683.1 lipopolysaccharide export system permease protein [Chiayiivirga flava]
MIPARPSDMLPRLSDRLIARNVLGALLLVWGTLLAFDLIGGFIEEVDEIGQGNYDALTAFFYIAYQIPRRAYTLFPTSAMIGCLLGMGALAATSELTALRSAGLSRLRICLSAVAVVGTLTLAMVVVGETIGPLGDQRSQALEVAAKSNDVAVAGGSGVWAREGDTFLNAHRGRSVGIGAEATIELDDVRLYEFDGDGRLLSIAVAARAQHSGGAWTLFDVRRSFFRENSVESSTVAQERWDSALNPDVLSLGVTRPRYLSTADLNESLAYLQRNGLDIGAFENAYWSRWFYPVNALVLCLAVLPFAFGTLRSGGLGKRLFLGIVFGLGYFMLQTLTVNMAEVFRFDLRLGNALPPLLVALGCWLYFRKRV